MAEMSLQERIRACRDRFEAAPGSRAFAPLADLLRQAGRHEEALGLLEDGLARHPGFQGAMVILGRTLREAGRADHARRVLERVLEYDADNVVVREALAELATEAGDPHDARRHLAHLQDLDPENPAWAKAIADLPETDPANPDPVAKSAANSEAASGATSGPTSTPPSAVAPKPGQKAAPSEGAFATLTLVDIYLAQGYRAKALGALREILAREPGREDVKRRIAELGPAPDDEGSRQGEPEAGAQQDRAERRAREKQHFTKWIDRIRTDEESTTP